MSNTTVSVAMCCYNMATFIEEQLDSLATQTRRPDELVVCDDGSSDGSVDLVRRFARRAPFAVRVIQNPHQLGCNKNFEQAIALCEGDIIFLCDHDDVWRSQKIAELLQILEDETIGAAFGNAAVVQADLSPMGYSLWDTCNFNPERRTRFASGAQLAELLTNNVMQGAAAAFRASFRPTILPIPSEWQHDYWIALMIAACGRIGFTEQCVLDYRQHGANLIGAGPRHRLPRPRTKLRHWPRRIGRWIEKARSPAVYYGRRINEVFERQRPLLVLRERLTQANSPAVVAALPVVDEALRNLQIEIDGIEEKLRRWAGAAAVDRLSRARQQDVAP